MGMLNIIILIGMFCIVVGINSHLPDDRDTLTKIALNICIISTISSSISFALSTNYYVTEPGLLTWGLYAVSFFLMYKLLEEAKDEFIKRTENEDINTGGKDA